MNVRTAVSQNLYNDIKIPKENLKYNKLFMKEKKTQQIIMFHHDKKN